MDQDPERLYQIALTFIPGAGNVRVKRLATYCGSASAAFREKKSVLSKIPGITSVIIRGLHNKEILERAERELIFMERERVEGFFFNEQAFPDRLKDIEDGPTFLYYRGNGNLHAKRMIGIVGTRMATDYGKLITEKLVKGLQGAGVTIVSGLAYGIDVCAHQAALGLGMETIGIPGHGLDRVYPSAHHSIATEIEFQGGILTEFPSGTKPDAGNFPQRNRIIAGLSDAVVIMEAGSKGGALITGRIANSYNRDVFAYPGRIDDPYSAGCNMLIKQNVAALVENAGDVLKNMNWSSNEDIAKPQPLFTNLSEEESMLVEVLKQRGKVPFEVLCIEGEIPAGKAAGILLNLEFAGLVKTLPGKMYQLTT